MSNAAKRAKAMMESKVIVKETPNSDRDSIISDLKSMKLNKINSENEKNLVQYDEKKNELQHTHSILSSFEEGEPEGKQVILKDCDTNALLNTDKELSLHEKNRMLQTLTKIFNLKLDNNQVQLIVNNEYIETDKMIQEKQERIILMEKENEYFYNSCRDKENEYIERIKVIERKLKSCDRDDVLFLLKQNNDYESQISNLSKTLQIISDKHSEEIHSYDGMMGDIMMLKDQLVKEISLVQALKEQIIELIKHEEVTEKDRIKLTKKYPEVNHNQLKKNASESSYKIRNIAAIDYTKI